MWSLPSVRYCRRRNRGPSDWELTAIKGYLLSLKQVRLQFYFCSSHWELTAIKGYLLSLKQVRLQFSFCSSCWELTGFKGLLISLKQVRLHFYFILLFLLRTHSYQRFPPKSVSGQITVLFAPPANRKSTSAFLMSAFQAFFLTNKKHKKIHKR